MVRGGAEDGEGHHVQLQFLERTKAIWNKKWEATLKQELW